LIVQFKPRTTAADIVEKATAILDKQAIGGAAGVPNATVPGLLGAALPELPGLPDLQHRLSEALADLLRMLAPPGYPGAEPAAAAVRTLSRSLSTLPVIEAAGPVSAGSTAMISLPLINDAAEAGNVVLDVTNFISDRGHHFPASEVKFSPSALSLGSHSQGSTTMHIPVPPQTVPGNYSALVQAIGLGRPCAVVVLRIE
jgi:hypothetical protein